MNEWPKQYDPTNPDAVPVYNSSFLAFLWSFVETNWSCNDWMTWHKAVTKKYGIERANSTFIKYWFDMGNGSPAIDCATTNDTFKSYAKSVNLYDHLFKGITGVINKGVGTAINTVNHTLDATDNIFNGLEKLTKIIIPLLVVLAIIFGYMYAVNAKLIRPIKFKN